MKDRAYAKINLALDVFNERADGYHDLKSIMIPITFFDEIEVNISDKDVFTCNKQYIEDNDKNTMYRMISLLKEKFGMKDCYDIKLNKVIPTQAGLGGGTSDAASILRIFKKMYNLDLTKQEEKDLCVAVGADVYMNYINRPAVVEGIGDIVKPFRIKKQYYVLLVKPRSGVSTEDAYEELDMKSCDHPNIDNLKTALEKGESIDGLLGNSLEQSSLVLNKEIKVIKDLLRELGCKNVLMSGSGSTVFTISESEQDIMNIYTKLKNKNYFVRFAKTFK